MPETDETPEQDESAEEALPEHGPGIIELPSPAKGDKVLFRDNDGVDLVGFITAVRGSGPTYRGRQVPRGPGRAHVYVLQMDMTVPDAYQHDPVQHGREPLPGSYRIIEPRWIESWADEDESTE